MLQCPFVRCYSAADQILTDVNAQGGIRWDGGAELTPTAQRHQFRLSPAGQMDLTAFRHHIALLAAQAYADILSERGETGLLPPGAKGTGR